MNDTKQTTLEDRVQKLEEEVNKMRDTIWVLETDIEDLILAQQTLKEEE